MNARANAERRRRRLGAARGLGATLALLVALAGGWTATAGAQTTPEAVIPPPQSEEPAETPAAAAEVDAGAPHVQTIAQGLVALDGPAVWRVREVTATAEAAATETAGFSFNLQRSGVSIVRNEATGRRVRLEAGEAFFMAADDAYGRTSGGPELATLWVFELVAPDARAVEGLGAGTVLFTSDIIGDYPVGTVDAEFARGTLLGNEVAELPGRSGPALLMVTSGRLQLSMEGAAPTPVNAGVGQLVTGALTLSNPDAQPAVFVVAGIGETVEAAEPAATTAPQSARTEEDAADEAERTGDAAEPTPAAEEVPSVAEAAETTAPAATSLDTDGDGLSDEEEAAYGSDALNRDFDADGLLDGAEVYQYGTDPLNNDSDADGLLDGEEVNQLGTSPVSADTDGEGLFDGDEIYVFGTGPTVFDTDGDGVGDGEEVNIYGTDPNDPSSGP